jgi:23S rRNA (uracil1939-C5)-methyltransferase
MTEDSPQLTQIKIEDVAIGGEGLGRISGKICFVPYGVPGDLLRIKITEEKKDYSRGEIVTLLEPSPLRRSAPCPVFGKCGGCLWQHIQIKAQEDLKSKLVRDLLRKRFPSENFEFLPLISSPHEFFYRNRITLKFDGSRLGYFARRSHEFVPIESCHLADPKINQSLDQIAKDVSLNKRHIKNLGKFSSVKIAVEDPSINQDASVQWALVQDEDLVSGFSQVNTQQNQVLKELVVHWFRLPESRVLYDLYAGSGNFTFPLVQVRPLKRVCAVEYDSSQTKAARKISEGFQNVQIFTAKVEDFVSEVILSERSCFLLDPPRGGCEEPVMSALAHSNPDQIIYVSCHPASLVRDIEKFFKKAPSGAYRLARVVCIDMFPQTDHIETVAEIVRA